MLNEIIPLVRLGNNASKINDTCSAKDNYRSFRQSTLVMAVEWQLSGIGGQSPRP